MLNRLIVIVTVVGVFAAAFPSPSAVSSQVVLDGRALPACAVRLTCDLDEFDRMTMAERLRVVQAMQRGPAKRFERDFARWNAIEAVIELFMANGLGEPGTWAGRIDAGILEAIMRGLALALGLSDDTYGNPGSRLWERYLLQLGSGRFRDKAEHNVAWSMAEDTATEWTVRTTPMVPTLPETTLYTASEAYRTALANEPTTMLVLRTIGQPWLTNCYNWLTDVTNRKPIRVYGQAIATFSMTPLEPHAVSASLADVAATSPECRHWSP
ncbi:hypothetical protein ACFQ07_23620, partial [Actinomadura adrarensis]